MKEEKKDSKSKQEDDDDEENDEDYEPEADNAVVDDNDDDDEMMIEAASTTPAHLTSMQIKQVDEAFEALFGYKWGTAFQLPDNPAAWTEQERLLCRMLGPADAAAVLQSISSGNNKNRPQNKIRSFRKHQAYKFHQTTVGTKAKDASAVAAKQAATTTSATRAAATAAAATTATSRASSTTSASSSKTTPGTTASATGGVDTLLKKLAGPTKVSTVAKTSSDWDKFKEQTGLGEKLEEQAESNTAFLKRQDFLSRVDNRKFEIEKQERERIRAKRGK